MRQTSGKLIGRAGFAALMLGQASQGLTFTAFTPGLPQMAQSFVGTGHGMEIAQQSVTIAALGVIAGSFLSGKIVEMFGTRSIILLSLLLYGLSGGAGLALDNIWYLLGSRIVNGFAAACLLTACVNMICLLFDGNARAKIIGVSAAMGSVASFAGLLIGGVLAQRFGWRVAFIQFPVFAVAGLTLAFMGISGGQVPIQSGLGTAAHSWTKLVPLFLLAIVISAVMFMGSTQLAFLLPQNGIINATTISLVMATITLFAIAVSMGFGWLEKAIGLQTTLTAGLAASAAGLALIGLVPNITAAFVGAALMGSYVGIVMPYLYHAVTLKTPAHARAKAIGLIGAFSFLGAFINPFLFGPLTKSFGLRGAFVITGGVMCCLALGALLRVRVTLAPVVLEHEPPS